MKSIGSNFEAIQKKNPQWGAYVCFREVIRGRGYTDRSVREAFNRYIDKRDYSENEKKKIIDELQDVAKGLEDSQK
ncbi:MAG: hypothetical protein ACD_37C00101G0002 [uncultured bacterium]|nr:MAG: hypothetical protein ACD_37C00101G0002 [uncultured bacterium]